jgi:hypothetical protein
MEDESHVVARAVLPKQCVVRRYSLDYGIDSQVEIFEYIDAEKRKADTLGEMFFVQLKSIGAGLFPLGRWVRPSTVVLGLTARLSYPASHKKRPCHRSNRGYNHRS